ncbi:MAG: hypothetical protein DRH08_11530 [Deltaproteobacteria bacterium]|nr:MAG: hypothetical protein DRH08_11530 [Deltaproteobacteria bacterium]
MPPPYPIFLRYMLLGVFCLLLSGCLSNREPVVRGVLHGELVWQGDVFVAGDVILADDVRLTILPGTRVRFMPPDAGPGGLTEHPHFPGSELIVQGQLYAVGTPSEPIIFEASDPAAPAGFWGAVNMEGSKEAVFEYCIFRQADSAVHSRDSQVYIEQSVFENNLVGIRFHTSEILIEHNLLRNNDTGIRFHFGSPVICENKFQDNNVNLFITSHPRDYHMENNSFGPPTEYHVAFGEEVPEDVRMPRNFWVQSETIPFDDFFFDGRRSAYLGRVLVEPTRTSPSTQTGLSWNP